MTRILRAFVLAANVIFYATAPPALVFVILEGHALQSAYLAALLVFFVPRDVPRLAAWMRARHQRKATFQRGG